MPRRPRRQPLGLLQARFRNPGALDTAVCAAHHRGGASPTVTTPISKSLFIGIEHVAHLAAGGEAPVLRSHVDASMRYLLDKGNTMPGRSRARPRTTKKRSRPGMVLPVSRR